MVVREDPAGAGAGLAAPSLLPAAVERGAGFAAIEAAARVASSASSAGESASASEQWM